MSVAFLCMFASMAAAQSISTRVTYFTRAARASVVVKELGRLAKIDLQATPNIDGEILVIDVKNQPLSELMSRIATVTDGEWKQVGPAYRLQANQALRSKEERDELEKRAKDIRKTILEQDKGERRRLAEWEQVHAYSERQKKVGPSATIDQGLKEKMESLSASFMNFFPDNVGSEDLSIGAITTTRLLERVDPVVLAKIKPGDVVVFSTKPTPTQFKLDKNAMSLVNELVEEYNKNNALSPPQTRRASHGGHTFTFTPPAHIGPISKTLVTVDINREFELFEVSLSLYGSDGKNVFTKSRPRPILFPTISATAETSVQAIRSATTKLVPTPKVRYSTDSIALTSGNYGQFLNVRSALSSGLRRKLFHPELYDPLSFASTDDILAFSRQSGKPLIADMSDDWVVGQSKMFEMFPGIDVKTVEKQMGENGEETVLADNTYTLVKPSSAPTSRMHRVNRFALRRLLRKIEENSVASIDEIASYAMHAPDPDSCGTIRNYIDYLVPDATVDENSQNEAMWEMLRVVASLSSKDRTILKRGGRIYFRSLNAIGRLNVSKMVYGADCPVTIQSNVPAWVPSDFRVGYLGEDPTEFAPSGLPNDGWLELRTTHESIAYPLDPVKVAIDHHGVLDPENFAELKSTDDNRSGPNVLGRLKIGTRSILNFTFQITPRVTIKQTLREDHIPKNAPIVTIDHLPANFRKQIADRLKAMKKARSQGQ